MLKQSSGAGAGAYPRARSSRLCVFLLVGACAPAADLHTRTPTRFDAGDTDANDDEGATRETAELDASTTHSPARLRDAAGSPESKDAVDMPRASDPSSVLRDAALATDAGEGMQPAVVSRVDATVPVAPPAFESKGPPLPGAKRRWTYTEIAGTQCRDGSPAGVAVNFGDAARKVMMFFEGGGYCINEETCFSNPANTLAQVLLLGEGAGVFDRDNPENPVRDWNFVYIPYCTGDRHGGANPDGNVPNVGPQRFVGYLNVQKYLARIVPTFPDATDVLVTGISAGGFGSLKNSIQVQRAFPSVKVKVIDDSGPPASKAVLPTCLQETWRSYWKLDKTILADCGAACPDHSDYWQDYGVFVARAFQDRPSGLIIATEDIFERVFFGVGNNGCTGSLDLLNPGVSASALRQDLLGFRQRIEPYPNFATFYPDNNLHTWISGSAFYTIRAGDMRLVDWFSKIVNGESPGHAGP